MTAHATATMAQERRQPARQGHGRVGVAKAGGDDVDRDARERQRGGVQVAQVVQPCVAPAG